MAVIIVRGRNVDKLPKTNENKESEAPKQPEQDDSLVFVEISEETEAQVKKAVPEQEQVTEI